MQLIGKNENLVRSYDIKFFCVHKHLTVKKNMYLNSKNYPPILKQ